MTALLPPTPAVLRSYRLSTYTAGAAVVRIGRRPMGWPAGCSGPERGPAVLLSACNPGGRRLPDGWNARAMRRLAQVLRRATFVRGEGRLGRWREPLVMAALPLPRGIVLARRFRQNAVVAVWPGRAARLVLLVPASSAR